MSSPPMSENSPSKKARMELPPVLPPPPPVLLQLLPVGAEFNVMSPVSFEVEQPMKQSVEEEEEEIEWNIRSPVSYEVEKPEAQGFEEEITSRLAISDPAEAEQTGLQKTNAEEVPSPGPAAVSSSAMSQTPRSKKVRKNPSSLQSTPLPAAARPPVPCQHENLVEEILSCSSTPAPTEAEGVPNSGNSAMDMGDAPEWLDDLLKNVHFGRCLDHPNELQNHYSIDSRGSGHPSCPKCRFIWSKKKNIPLQRTFELMQIVPESQLKSLVDCSDIQVYEREYKNFGIRLHPRPKEERECQKCGGRFIKGPYKYCSAACKFLEDGGEYFQSYVVPSPPRPVTAPLPRTDKGKKVAGD